MAACLKTKTFDVEMLMRRFESGLDKGRLEY
jgi:hypothetical protein